MTPPKDRAELVALMMEPLRKVEDAGMDIEDTALDVLAALEAAGVAQVPGPYSNPQGVQATAAAYHRAAGLDGHGRPSFGGLDALIPAIEAYVATSPYAPNPEARSDG